MLRSATCRFVSGKEAREIAADDFVGPIAFEPMGTLVPARDVSRRIEHEDRVIAHTRDEQPKALITVLQQCLRSQNTPIGAPQHQTAEQYDCSSKDGGQRTHQRANPRDGEKRCLPFIQEPIFGGDHRADLVGNRRHRVGADIGFDDASRSVESLAPANGNRLLQLGELSLDLRGEQARRGAAAPSCPGLIGADRRACPAYPGHR